jgi:mannose-1-phosphate guanylyltransferase
VKAVVLVGGEGTRLRPLTYKTPKGLLPIANQPFLERQLTWLEHHGIDDVVLSLGYLPDAFREHFDHGATGEGRFRNIRLRFREEPEPLGTAGGIGFAAAGITERVVVCNGDVLTDLDLSAMLRFHAEHGAEATISLSKVEDPSAFGVVPTRDDGEVIAFVEKPPPGRAPTDWINAGTYVLEPSVLDRIPPRLTVSIERETFPRMLDQPRRLFGFHSDAYWLDIGTPGKYLQAQTDVLAGRVGLPPAPDARERAPGIWVEGDVLIADDARIEGPVLLGAGVSIAAGARVADSVVGPGASIGVRADLDRVVVLEDGNVDPDARLADVVVGPAGLLPSPVWG